MRAKFNEAQKRNITSLYASGMSMADIARKYDVDRTTILRTLGGGKAKPRKITAELRGEIKYRYRAEGVTQAALAKIYGVCAKTICVVLSENRYRKVSVAETVKQQSSIAVDFARLRW